MLLPDIMPDLIEDGRGGRAGRGGMPGAYGVISGFSFAILFALHLLLRLAALYLAFCFSTDLSLLFTFFVF